MCFCILGRYFVRKNSYLSTHQPYTFWTLQNNKKKTPIPKFHHAHQLSGSVVILPVFNNRSKNHN
jgi:hypothetical protein